MRTFTSLAAAALATALLTSCSNDAPSTAGATRATDSPSSTAPSATPVPSTPATTPEPTGPVLSITVEGDRVAPNGERIELAAGEPLALEFTSDRPGELHVHARPEQYVQFEAGTSTQELVIDNPGLVEVEDHDTGDVVAQIEVR